MALLGPRADVVCGVQAEQVLGGARSSRADAEVLADASVLTQYRRMTGNDVASSSSSAAGPGGAASKQRPIEGECAICYDTLQVGSPVGLSTHHKHTGFALEVVTDSKVGLLTPLVTLVGLLLDCLRWRAAA